MLGQMSRSFQFRDKVVWIRLYKTFVRHHLEQCVQAWSPWYAKDCDLLESVQKRAVNMVKGLRATTYDGKLKELKLPSLTARRTRGDMIQIWKYLHGANLGGENLLSKANADHSRITRHTVNPLNISRSTGNCEVRKNSFVPRCADLWNSLPMRIQNAET